MLDCLTMKRGIFLSGIADIINGIYGNKENAIIVYSLYGEVIWKNKAAVSLLDNDAEGIIFAGIIENTGSSGKIRYADGGTFHKAVVCDMDLYIAELYSESRLTALFEDHRVNDYAVYSEMLVRQAVTGISASCEIINDLIENAEKDDAELCLNNIISCCCRIMKKATLSSQLASIAHDRNIKPTLINIDNFLSEFTSGCKQAFGDKSRVSYNSETGCLIYADKTLLTYFMLELLCCLISSWNTSCCNIIIAATEIDGYAEIKISRNITAETSQIGQSGIPSRAFKSVEDELCRIFAETLKAEYSFSDDTLNISIKCAENNDKAVLETEKIYLSDSLFSPYNIMLNDFTDFRTFY